MKKIGTLKNVDNEINNLITLIKGNNDVYDGLISYIYFRVLKLSPVEFFEKDKEEKDNYSKEEIDDYQKEFVNYDKYVITKELRRETEEVIIFIREEALKDKIIIENKDYYKILKKYFYDSKYIFGKILKYYHKQKMEED